MHNAQCAGIFRIEPQLLLMFYEVFDPGLKEHQDYLACVDFPYTHNASQIKMKCFLQNQNYIKTAIYGVVFLHGSK